MAYQPEGIFREGFTLEEVQGILASAKSKIIDDGGEEIVSWSASGQQAASRFNLKPTELIAECIYALKLLDPENYPTTPDRSIVSLNSFDEYS